MLLDDLAYRFFQAISQRVGLGLWFGLATALALAGLAVLIVRRRRMRAGWGLLITSAAIAWIGLLTVSETRVEERVSRVMRARVFAYGDLAREAAQAGLLVVPVLGWLANMARDKVERDHRRSLFSTYLRIATKAYYDGDYDRAVAEYSIAIKVEPKRTDCYVKRGLAWMQKSEYDRAIADFDRALVLSPNHAAAYLNRGIVLAARGDHDRALVDFERALELGPNDATPLLYRGLSLAKLGDTTRAAEEFRRVLKLTNHSDFVEPAQFHLAMIEGEPKVAQVLAGS